MSIPPIRKHIAPESLLEPLPPLPLNDEGIPVLDVPHLKEVALGNLAEVAEHSIVEGFGSVSHHVRFRTGGVLRFAYSNSGKLLELSFEHVWLFVTSEGTAVFRMRSAEEIASGDKVARAWRMHP